MSKASKDKSQNKKRKRIIRIAVLLGTLGSLFLVPWLLVWAWIRPLPETVNEQLNQAVDYGFNGVITYVDQGGHSPKLFMAGWHNKATETKAKPDAYFKIASISKLYDAVAVTKLVNVGLLSLDKTITDYLPSLRGRIANSDQITLAMLVEHRSGIPNYTDTPDYWSHPLESAADNLALVLDQPANFEPGADYEYCNTNYALLNMIMDTVLGYKNFNYIQNEILSPLNLRNTHASINAVNSPDIMSGYHQGYDADLKTDNLGMIATAEDIGIFLRALNTGNLLSKKEHEIYSSIYKYEHSGWVPGYESFALYYEDIDAVIVTFYSTTDPDLILWNLAEIINTRIYKIIKNGTDTTGIIPENPPSEKTITQENLMEESAISFMNHLKANKQLNSFFGNNWTLVYHEDNRCNGSTDGTIANLSPEQIDQEIKLQVTNDGQGWACDTVASSTYEMRFNLNQLVQDWDRFTVEDYEYPEKNCLYIEGKGASDYLKLYYNNAQSIIKLEYRSEDPG